MKWCRIAGLSLIFFLCGTPAWADNCGSLSDCYYVIWNAMLAAGAIGIALSLFLDFLPIIGDIKGIYEGITGRDSITGQELEGWERAIGMIPILGRLGDIAKLAGIAADMARVADNAADTARAAAAAGDTARAASAATDAAKAANAAGDAARAASDAVKAANAAGDTSKAASAASDVAKAIDAAKDASKSANAAADAAHSVGATAEAAKASEAAKNAEKAVTAASGAGKSVDTATDVAHSVDNIQNDILKKVENGELELNTSARKGNFGEIATDIDLTKRGYEPLHTPITDIDTPTKHGIDGVFKKGDEYYVVESKYHGTAGLGTLKDGTRQMSDDWIEPRLNDAVGLDIADEIRATGYTRVLSQVDKNGNIVYKLIDSKGYIVKGSKFEP